MFIEHLKPYEEGGNKIYYCVLVVLKIEQCRHRAVQLIITSSIPVLQLYLMFIGNRVVDPDPDPYWIRIQLGLWIRIRIQNTDPDQDPGGQK